MTTSAAAQLTPEKALIFRVTHIANVPWILEHGLHCRNAGVCDPNYREIGDPDLIDKRAHREVQVPPRGTLSDYIPFYFTPFSPMLYKIKTGHQGINQIPMPDIVVLVSSLHKLTEQGVEFVFTDRHAYLQTASFSRSMEDLKLLDWRSLRARDFKRNPDDPGKFERYQAEALIHRHLPLNALAGVACNGPAQRSAVEAEVAQRGLGLQVLAMPEWYF
jgi:hypothetical protein